MEFLGTQTNYQAISCRRSPSFFSQDRQIWLRSLWLEIFSYSGLNLKHIGDVLVQDTPSTLITDCKSLCGALAKVESSGLQLTEQRSALECHGCKQRLTQTNAEVRWVSSDRQLADGLTKSDEQAAEALKETQRMGYWRIVLIQKLPQQRRNANKLFKPLPTSVCRANSGQQNHNRTRMCTQDRDTICALSL